MTPEGKVKERIKKVLDLYAGRIYYNMPVPYGYGAPMLDFVGCFYGKFFAIEAKAEGKVPTTRQEDTIERMCDGRARVFVIDGDTAELEHWLAFIDPLP